MKIYILFIVLFVFGLIEAKAQCLLTNADLENWSSSSSATGWYSFNNASSVSKSSTAESNSFAASINIAGGVSRVYCDFLQPISCTQKPTSFNGYYKYTTTNIHDSLLFFAAVTPGFITSIQDTATASGYGAVVITSSSAGSSYVSFTVPINYRNSNATTYVTVGALSIRNGVAATNVLLDNFSLSYPTSTTAVAEARNTQISLNTDLNKEEINFSNIQGKATLEIFNMAGTKVAEKMLTEADATMSIGTFRSGLYLAKVSMNDTQTTLKFLK